MNKLDMIKQETMLQQNLSISLRPKNLNDLIGMEDIANQIRSQIDSGRVPVAWLFSGELGSGKTTLARILAVSIQCNHNKPFGEYCPICWDLYDSNSFSITEINTSYDNGVNEARALIDRALMLPLEGKYRVIILDEAQKLTDAAQNALLIPFDTSNTNTIWIICTTAPAKIIKPLRSRCLSFVMPGVGNEKNLRKLLGQSLEILKQNHVQVLTYTVVEELVSSLLANNISSPRLVLMALEKVLAGATPQEAAQVNEVTSINTIELCRAVLLGDWIKSREVLAKATPDDGRGIRAAVAGYFRAVLLKSDGKRATVCANAIQELASYSSFEDGLTLSMTAASIYKICESTKEAAKETANGKHKTQDEVSNNRGS